jgi:hypothetical protein
MVLKLDVAFIIAVIAGGALWLEHENRQVIDAPDAGVGTVPACPDNDNMPYTARCLEFLTGATGAGMHWRINATDSAAAAESSAPN